jgi:hypothetical protein
MDTVKWKPRLTDGRSRSLSLTLAGLVAGVSWLVLLLTDHQAHEAWVKGLILAAEAIGLLVFYVLVAEIAFGLIAFIFNRRIVEDDHKGIILFRGNRTGEIAGPGEIILPIGYGIELKNTQFDIFKISDLDVLSSDGFSIGAEISASLAERDLLKSNDLRNPSEQISDALRNILRASAAGTKALELVSNTEKLSSDAVEKLKSRFGKFGFDVMNCDINFTRMSPELMKLRAIVSQLRHDFPQITDDEILKFVRDQERMGSWSSIDDLVKAIIAAAPVHLLEKQSAGAASTRSLRADEIIDPQREG